MLLLVAVGGIGVATAAGIGLPHSLTLQLSSRGAGVRPVALSLVFSYEMQCGYPGPGPVLVRLPPAEHVPARIATDAVLVDGKAATAVTTAGRELTIELRPPPRVMCDVIGPGRLTIELTRTAGLGNPGQAGSYSLTATARGSTFAASFSIRPH